MRTFRIRQIIALLPALFLLAIILLFSRSLALASSSESIEPLPLAQSYLNPVDNTPAAECLLWKDDNVAYGFYRFFKIGDRVVTYHDPVVCEEQPYPFAINGFGISMFGFGEAEWPATIDLIIFAADSGANCNGPGEELFRFTTVVDQAAFEVPQNGSISLPEPFCVNGPFYAGIEYSAVDSAVFPAVVFDTHENPDSCDNWMFRDTLWYQFDNFWGNNPGYPIVRIEGETVASLCCPDADEDAVCDQDDNCPTVANVDQTDTDLDGIGDECDNCPTTANADQLDFDSDQTGDECDDCPFDPYDDADGDGVCADLDNCPCDPNPLQADSDSDGTGDVCQNCCTGLTGDIDDSLDGQRNLADITRLIDRVYISQRRLCCEKAGNVDGDLERKLNLSDINRLIDHIYISKGDTEVCL